MLVESFVARCVSALTPFAAVFLTIISHQSIPTSKMSEPVQTSEQHVAAPATPHEDQISLPQVSSCASSTNSKDLAAAFLTSGHDTTSSDPRFTTTRKELIGFALF